MSKQPRFRYSFDMSARVMARDKLWDVADVQHGFLTAKQAAEAGVATSALQMLVHRGTLEKVAHGVYRFPKYPVGSHDAKMLAVLWTGAEEAALSHETALDAYEISDANPNRIHVTVAKRRRIRRAGGDDYEIHYEDLDPAQVGWWSEIPMVTAATAIVQCIDSGTTASVLRQAIERGHARGYLTMAQRDELAERLEKRLARRSRLDEMTRRAYEDGLYDVDVDAYSKALAEARRR